MAQLEPKEIEVKTLNGELRTYILSRFPCIAGREIVAGYPLTGFPKIGEYAANEAIMLKLMAYVAVVGGNGQTLQLTTKALVENHVPDYETLVKIEIEMMRYNTSFFGKGEISTFFVTTITKLVASISPMLTPLLGQFLTAAKRR